MIDEAPVEVLDPGPPARRIVLPLAAVDANRLGVGELAEMGAALGTDFEGIAAAMRSGGVPRARILVALAWVIVRRAEPDVTFAEAMRWRIEVATDDADPTPAGAAPPPIDPSSDSPS